MKLQLRPRRRILSANKRAPCAVVSTTTMPTITINMPTDTPRAEIAEHVHAVSAMIDYGYIRGPHQRWPRPLGQHLGTSLT
jgi:hypothetical protein